MTKFRQRIICIQLVLVVMMMFSACKFDFLNKEPQKPKAELILGYIEERNTDAIYEMLCQRLKNQPNIERQIEEFFDFMDGKVISYETGYSSGSGAWENGKARVKLLSSCKDMITDKGNQYYLSIPYYDENGFEPDLIGVYGISLIEINPEGTTADDRHIKELNIETDISSELVLKYIKYKNSDALFDLFCEKTKKIAKNNIDEAFDFMQGNVVSYTTESDDYDYGNGDDGLFKKAIKSDCYIKTDCGYEYRLNCRYFYEDYNKDDITGIFSIDFYETEPLNNGYYKVINELSIPYYSDYYN